MVKIADREIKYIKRNLKPESEFNIEEAFRKIDEYQFGFVNYDKKCE